MIPIMLLFGPMLIGTFLNTILYGILVVQIFIYYQTYKKDSASFRLFVLYLFFSETLNTGFDIAMMYEPLVLRYGSIDATTFFPRMLAADPVMTIAISTPIQLFVAWRIRIISESNLVALVICAFALISCGGGIWTTFTVTVVRRFSQKPQLHWPALTWLLSSAVADVLITGTLVFSLSRRKTGFTGTDNTINRIIRLTIQTGLVTAIFAAADVVFFLALPHTTLNFVWDFALSKLYSNALISTLNARAGWNSIANGYTANNVLFGDISGEVVRSQTFNTHYSVNHTFNTRHLHVVSTEGYSMDQRSFTNPENTPDADCGIVITKDADPSEVPIPESLMTTRS